MGVLHIRFGGNSTPIYNNPPPPPSHHLGNINVEEEYMLL